VGVGVGVGWAAWVCVWVGVVLFESRESGVAMGNTTERMAPAAKGVEPADEDVAKGVRLLADTVGKSHASRWREKVLPEAGPGAAGAAGVAGAAGAAGAEARTAGQLDDEVVQVQAARARGQADWMSGCWKVVPEKQCGKCDYCISQRLVPPLEARRRRSAPVMPAGETQAPRAKTPAAKTPRAKKTPLSAKKPQSAGKTSR